MGAQRTMALATLDLDTGELSPGGTLATNASAARGVLLRDGRVLFVGGTLYNNIDDEHSMGIRVRPYLRVSAIIGVDVVRDLRLFAQGGFVFSPFPGMFGDDVYVPVYVLDASAEWYVDEQTSLFASIGWATQDPFFTHGPSGSLGIRSVLPATGPGSVRRTEAERVRWIARRWNRARTDEWTPRYTTPPQPPRSMLRSRMPVPDWMWSILGARDAWEQAPAATVPDADNASDPPE